MPPLRFPFSPGRERAAPCPLPRSRRDRKRLFVPRRSAGNEPPSGRHSAPGSAARPRGLFCAAEHLNVPGAVSRRSLGCFVMRRSAGES